MALRMTTLPSIASFVPRRHIVALAAKRSPKRLKYSTPRFTKEGGLVSIEVDPCGADAWKLQPIIDLLKQGAVGVIPTDTLYAIACDCKNHSAVERLRRIKKIDSSKPLSILCCSFRDIDTFTMGFPRGDGHGHANVFRAVKQCLPGPVRISFLLSMDTGHITIIQTINMVFIFCLVFHQLSISNSTSHRVWRTYEGGPNNMGVSIFEPINLPRNFFKLGFYAQPNNRKLFGWILVARDVSGSSLRPPFDYIEVGNTTSLNIKQDMPAHFWHPLCPNGYQAVGLYVTTSPLKPSLGQDSISCVRSDLTEQSEADTWVWGIKEMTLSSLRTVKRGIAATCVYTGTFSFKQHAPPPPLFCLKNVEKDSTLERYERT